MVVEGFVNATTIQSLEPLNPTESSGQDLAMHTATQTLDIATQHGPKAHIQMDSRLVFIGTM